MNDSTQPLQSREQMDHWLRQHWAPHALHDFSRTSMLECPCDTPMRSLLCLDCNMNGIDEGEPVTPMPATGTSQCTCERQASGMPEYMVIVESKHGRHL